MLKKLTKHELYATGRIFLPIYAIMLLLSLINRVLFGIDNISRPLNTLRGFMVAAYVISIIATLVVTFVIMILRFYRNLMSDEGYLMFTLPVKTSQLINAKLIVSLLWNITCVIVVAASLFIVLGTAKNMAMFRDVLDTFFTVLKDTYGSSYVWLIVEYIVLILVGLIQQILLIYVSIAIGHMLNDHKVIGSFAAYIGIHIIIQTLVTIIFFIWARFETSLFAYAPYFILKQVFPFSIIFSIILNILFYLGTNYIFKRKLNLE